MNNQFVIISSLFDIKREKMDGRSWSDYLKWFDITLKLKCPMILFVSEDMSDFIIKRRIGLPTNIVTQTIEQVPYFYLKDQIDCVLSSSEYKQSIKDSNRIECLHSMYSIIQYSKFKWLETATKLNPFESKFFFWLDAGGSRFFEDYNLSDYYPSDRGIDILNSMGDKFLVQMNMMPYSSLANSSILSKDYLLDNRSYVLGSMFGGTNIAILNIRKRIDDLLVNDMLSKNLINNEQIAIGYLLKSDPHLFSIYKRYNDSHMALFREIGKK